MIRKRAMKYMEIALENQHSIPLSNNSYVDGFGEFVTRTVAKEGNEYILYKMDKNNPGDYQRKKITKQESLKEIAKYIGTFSKQNLIDELEYWKECVHFLQEENDITFINSYLSNTVMN
ncbi:hypothetical protein R3O67_33140 [Bacillus cereus]